MLFLGSLCLFVFILVIISISMCLSYLSYELVNRKPHNLEFDEPEQNQAEGW